MWFYFLRFFSSFAPFPSSPRDVSGDTIKYPIKFCIFYNLMRDLCVRTFLFRYKKILFKKEKKKSFTNTSESGTWRWREFLLGAELWEFFHTNLKESEKSLRFEWKFFRSTVFVIWTGSGWLGFFGSLLESYLQSQFWNCFQILKTVIKQRIAENSSYRLATSQAQPYFSTKFTFILTFCNQNLKIYLKPSDSRKFPF